MKVILILIILFTSPMALSNSFNLGVGGAYYITQLPQNSGAQSVYQGPGYVIDGRIRFLPYKQKPSFSFDIFGEGGQAFATNTGASDTHQQDLIFGGIDINIYRFSFGVQYGRAKSFIHTSTGNSQFAYDLIGARGGFKILSGLGWAVVLNAIYQTGTAIPGGDNSITTYQKVNDWMGTLIFQYQLVGDRTY